jgi:predicted nucleic acid-binding Zn ribbon protein
MKRKIYGGGFIKFNGAGFYETDYKNKKEKE